MKEEENLFNFAQKKTIKYIPNHLSFSQLSLYEQCPNCYYTRYILKIKEPENENLLFGSYLHEEIAKYHGRIFKQTGINQTRIYNFDISDYLSQYTNRITKEAELVEYANQINFEIDSKRKIDIPIKFIIDLVKDNVIIDHKTSSKPYDENHIKNDHQLTLYSYAYRKLFNKKEDGVRYNVFIKRKNPILEIYNTERTESDYENFYLWAKPLIDGILNNRWYYKPRLYGHICCL